jgi:hypothetical protein
LQGQQFVEQRERWLAGEFAAAAKPSALREDWPGLTLPGKRTYIRAALVCVLVHPTTRKRFYPDRLEPVLREDWGTQPVENVGIPTFRHVDEVTNHRPTEC